MLLSVGPFEGVASAGFAVNGSVSADVDLAAFFFFADLDSDLTAGFWAVEAAIVKIDGGLTVS